MTARDVLTLADLGAYLTATGRALRVRGVRRDPACVAVTLEDGLRARDGYGSDVREALVDAETCLEAELAIEAGAEGALTD